MSESTTGLRPVNKWTGRTKRPEEMTARDRRAEAASEREHRQRREARARGYVNHMLGNDQRRS